MGFSNRGWFVINAVRIDCWFPDTSENTYIWSSCARNACIEWDRCELETECCSFFSVISTSLFKWLKIMFSVVVVRFDLVEHMKYACTQFIIKLTHFYWRRTGRGGKRNNICYIDDRCSSTGMMFWFECVIQLFIHCICMENIDHITQLKWNSNHEQISQFNRKRKIPHAAAIGYGGYDCTGGHEKTKNEIKNTSRYSRKFKKI